MTIDGFQPGRWGQYPIEAQRRAWTQTVDLILAEILSQEATLFASSSLDASWRSNLYNGYLGTALFLAAGGRARQNDSAVELARRLLSSFKAPLPDVTPVSGAFVGPLSLALGYRQIAGILGQSDLFDHATDLAVQWAKPSSSHHDVISGNAGTILAVLDLRKDLPPDDTRRSELLRTAEACAEGILRHGVRVDGLPVACPSETGAIPQTGFAHGASGIALALFLLFLENAESEIHRFACGALEFERALFSTDLRSWPTSPAELNSRPNAWCFGAPGIALARAAILRAFPERDSPAGVVDDFRTALDVLWQAVPVPLEHLCCGMFSRVEAFRALSVLFEDERLYDAAAAIATWSLRAVKARRRFALGGETVEERLTLFHGLPGVGYALVRLMEREDSSLSVLLPVSLKRCALTPSAYLAP